MKLNQPYGMQIRHDRARVAKVALVGIAAMSAGLYAGCARQTRVAIPPIAYPFHIIAHRGGAGLAPENTLPAFRRSLARGVFEVELDVRLSRDGIPILFHDSRLELKTGEMGTVADYSARELARMRVGQWFERVHPEIPGSFDGTTVDTLEQLFSAFGGRLYYHVELKGRKIDLPVRVLEMVARFGLEERVTITSFNRTHLERVRRLTSNLPICLIFARADQPSKKDLSKEDLLKLQKRHIDAAASSDFQQVAVNAGEVTPELVAYARKRGLTLRAWGVSSKQDMDRVIRSGANGMTIDRPDVLAARIMELLSGR